MSIENIMPEQDVGWMQEYIGQPAYDNQNGITNVNVIFSKLINVKKTRPSWEYNWYLDWFAQTPRENGNYQNRWYEKRDWFSECWSYTDDDLTWWNVKDIATRQWERYFMYVNNDWTKLRVYKQCWWNRQIDCDSYLLSCCEWHYISIPKFNWEKDFDTTPCSSHKFVHTFWPKQLSNTDAIWCEWKLRAYRIWNTIVHMLYNSIWRPITIRPWQYIYWYDSEWDAIMWRYRSAKWYITHEWKSGIQLNGFVPWLVATLDWLTDWDYVETSGLCYKIYETVWETLSFAWDWWAYQIHNASCEESDSDITPYWAMFSDSLYAENINSLFTYWWALWYIAWDVLYISEWWQNPWVFTNIIWQDAVYTDVIEYGNYWYLMWPDSFWILYKLTYQNWTSEYRISKTDKWEWYFNKWSYYGHRWAFYVATHDDKWYATIKSLFLNQQYDKGNGLYTFDVWYSTISNNFIQDHIATANVFHWDKIYFSHEWDELIITITDNRIWYKPQYTKMLRYNSLDKDWVVRMICWLHITHYKHWCYYWDWLFINEWDTDVWNEIKEIIWITFWQLNPDKAKLIDSISITIGNHSRIWSDSYFLKEVDYQWYRLRKKEKNYFSSEYVNNLIDQENLILADKYDHIEQGKLFKNMPLWFVLNWWNGHTTVEDLRTTRNEMQVYCAYNKYHYWVCTDCCKEHSPNEQCCDVVWESRPNNMYDNDDEHVLVLSRFCTLWQKINNMWNAFYFEYIIWGKDNLQFFKYAIMWKQNNSIQPKAENWLWNQFC